MKKRAIKNFPLVIDIGWCCQKIWPKKQSRRTSPSRSDGRSKDAAGTQISGVCLHHESNVLWFATIVTKSKTYQTRIQNIKQHHKIYIPDRIGLYRLMSLCFIFHVVGIGAGDRQVAWWRGCIGIWLLVSNLWLLLNVPCCVTVLICFAMFCHFLFWQGWKQSALPSRLSWRLQRLHALTCILAVDGSGWYDMVRPPRRRTSAVHWTSDLCNRALSWWWRFLNIKIRHWSSGLP